MAMIYIGPGADVSDLKVTNCTSVGTDTFMEVASNAKLSDVNLGNNLHVTGEGVELLKFYKARGEGKKSAIQKAASALGLTADGAGVFALLSDVWDKLP